MVTILFYLSLPLQSLPAPNSHHFFSIKLSFLSFLQNFRLKMANAKHPFHHLLLLTLFLAALLLQGIRGSRVRISLNHHHTSTYKDGWKRMLIGSVAPICTFNECRGCKYRCIAEQVPIEGNDPINSAYYYKCVCHR